MSQLRAYLQLCRFPAVFTALADIFLGFLLVHTSLVPVREFICLLLASAGLYLAGMVLNDLFDRERDAAERPSRPIPSGRIAPRQAVILAACLIAAGLSAAWAASTWSLVVALLLLACILGYDGGLKRTPLGPPAMGLCRALNVLLGTSSAAGWFTQLFNPPQSYVAAALGLYIVGVTWFARNEASRSGRAQLALSAVVINLGLGGLLLLTYGPAALTVSWNGGGEELTALVLLAVIALTINRRVVAACLRPEPSLVQTAVKTMLLSLITLDAALIYFKLGPAGVVPAMCVVAMLAPAVLLGRWMAIT